MHSYAMGAILLSTLVALVTHQDASLAQAIVNTPPSEGEAEVGNADLDDYVKAYGVSPEEAREHWAATDIAGELQADLIKTQGDIFGGLWIEREPTFAVVIGVVAGGEKTVRAYVDKFDLAEVTRVQQVLHTLEQLQADQAAISAAADAAGIDIAAGVDQAEGQVMVFVETAEDASVLTRLQLPGTANVVQQDLPTPAVEIYGGLPPTTCTTGFNVQRIGAAGEGVSIAGHCPNSQSYLGDALPFIQQQYSGNTDAQWHTTPTFTDPNKIRVTSSGTTRNVTSRKPLSQMVQGEAVCKYGTTTLFDCGEISIVPYDPGDTCVPSSGSTYVRVDPNPNAGDMAEGGDSGGPVFHNNPAKAYGTISCQSGVDMIFMPQNFLPNIGVEVDITTP